MDWKLFAQLLATFFVAAFGWWVAHSLSDRRDLANERRKLRVNYLLDAYRKLRKRLEQGRCFIATGKPGIRDWRHPTSWFTSPSQTGSPVLLWCWRAGVRCPC